MRTKRFMNMTALTLMLGLLAGATPALADGGKVQFSQIVDPYRITVFTSPTPMQAGPIDASVLVQDAESGSVIHDALLDFKWKHESTGAVLRHRATHAQSTNKMMQSAKFDLPMSGVWDVTLDIQKPTPASVSFKVLAYEETNNSLMVTFLVTLPFAAIGLFLLREHIRVPRQSHSG